MVDGTSEALTAGDTDTRTSGSNHALHVKNGDNATGDNLTLNATGSSKNPVVRADSSGTTTLNHATITNNNQDGGVYLKDTDSGIIMTGGSIGNIKKEAVGLGKNTSATFNNVVISADEKVIAADKNSTLTMAGGSITSGKDELNMDESATATFTGVTITTDRTSIDCDEKSILILTDSSITSGREGVKMDKKSTATINGTVFSTDLTTIETRGTLALTGADITVTGSGTSDHGVYVRDGDATLTNGTIQTNRGSGILTFESKAAVAKSTSIHVHATIDVQTNAGDVTRFF